MPIRTKMPQYRQVEGEPDPGEPLEDPSGAAKDLLLGLLKGHLSIGHVLDLSADDLERLVDLGRGHLAAGRSAEARRVFDGLIALEPRVAVGHQLFAMACEAENDLDTAQIAYTKAIHLMADTDDPGLCAAYLGRGTVRQRQGDVAGALTDLALARVHSDGQDPVVVQTVEVLEKSCAAQLDSNN